jgi:hypothetical protein
MIEAIPQLQQIWNTTSPQMLCSFRGITCEENKIIQMDLENLGLVGIIPGSVFSLANLTKLNLSGNQILRSLHTGACLIFRHSFAYPFYFQPRMVSSYPEV